MKINCKVEYYEYKNRIRNLTTEAQGVVKSKKFFPVYLNNGKEEIFKPISKTKPFATPFFAYSEVFWSTVINKYFDRTAPIYRLAICNGYSSEVPKYHNHGVIVPSVIDKDEKLINLLEYFKEHKDESFNQEDYINYCMVNYDYVSVFNTKIIKENYGLGRSLASQVLISILKADQNFHYENLGFIEKDGVLKIQPPLDHEFSTMFLYPDDIVKNHMLFEKFLNNLIIKELKTFEEKLFAPYLKDIPGINRNLDFIIENYEEVVLEFINYLQLFINDLENGQIEMKDDGYLFPFNTDNYEAGIEQYKNNNKKQADTIMSNLKQFDVDILQINKLIHIECLVVSRLLMKNLIYKLEQKHQKKLSR